MSILNSQLLLEEIKNISPEGLEVWTRMGLLSSTKAIYFHEGLVYIFQMEYDFIFSRENGLTVEDFLKEYDKWKWKIEQIIS